MRLKLQRYRLKAGFIEILSYARQLLLQLLSTFTIHNKLRVHSVVLGSAKDDSSVFRFHNCFVCLPSKNRAAQRQLFLEVSAVPNPQSQCRCYFSQAKRYSTALSFQKASGKQTAAQIECV